jgi:tetratricopeptide (TPR) repeat protein
MVCLLFLLLNQFDLSPTESYNLGNAYFEQGKYSEAIAAYEQASRGLASARVFYNLGNAYFKKGMHGKAILNYRKALYIVPRDRDIAHNLNFTRTYRVDKISSESSPLVRLLAGIFQFVSLYEAQILTTLFFIVASVLLSFYIIHRRSIIGYVAIVMGFLCILFFISWQVWAADLNSRPAVIISPEAKALSGPGEEYKEIIVIHDGAEVRVRERRGDYFLIQLPGGVGGWVPVDAVEPIYGIGV